jgi:hypothetical protein
LEIGGAEEDRTPDLLIANETLSQLSYGPTCVKGAHCSIANGTRKRPVQVLDDDQKFPEEFERFQALRIAATRDFAHSLRTLRPSARS